MPAIARLGDLLSTHVFCNSTHNLNAGSPNVLINGIPASRVGDISTMHCLHTGTQITGSSSVLINGVPVARVGDSISCGSVNLKGSDNVSAG